MDAAFQELLEEFLLEARERADAVETLMLGLSGSSRKERDELIAQAKRQLHTLKGNSGMMGFGQLQKLSHRLEDLVEALDLDQPQVDAVLERLDQLRRRLEVVSLQEGGDQEADDGGADSEEDLSDFPATETGRLQELVAGSVRVPFAKIDHLVELLAETLVQRNRLNDAIARGLAQAAAGVAATVAPLDAWDDVHLAFQALEKTLKQVQEHAMDLGMVPLSSLFRSLGRIVHDESNRIGKAVDFKITGGDTPIDKALLETAGEALGHLVRNAVIHGIEKPAERRRQKKPERGQVAIAATIQAGEVRIEVADDGAGINTAALRARARTTDGEADSLSTLALLFEEGVSTSEAIDLGAGRGVGLSAVKRSVEKSGGRIEVRSSRGRGTVFVLRLPLTASILRSLLLEVDREHYALPMNAITETLRLEEGEPHMVNHARVLRWRGQLIPQLDLGIAFGTSASPRTTGYTVIIESNGRHRALAADDIAGIRDIVVRGLDPIVGQPSGISGSTVLGDGRVVMILDPTALTRVSPFVDTEASA